ncbi:MAG TPA: FAD-binding oxidoreductase, partial [Bacteroidia bacterium]|nr:FAD-binding oxidoreductase [Bacteroidia bacterium]
MISAPKAAPARSLSPSAVATLRELVGAENVLIEPEDLVPYGFDGTAALKHGAVCVAMPRTCEAVAAVMKFAHEAGIPVVTRGSGTGLSGGSVPVDGGIVLTLVHLNRILEIDPANLTMLAEAGTITKAIDDAAHPHGLFYPPDPGSMKISTIG